MSANLASIRPETRVDVKNAALKCTLNDGGALPWSPGFRGTCSDALMEVNCARPQVWCGRPENNCNRFLRGLVAKRPTHPCYESQLLTHWEFGLGVDFESEQSRRARYLGRGSVVLMTTRPRTPGNRERDRYIFGAFLVRGVMTPREAAKKYGTTYGYVLQGDASLGVHLPEDAHIPFWEVFRPKPGKKPSWRRNLFRYMDDEQVRTALEAMRAGSGNVAMRKRIDALAAAAGLGSVKKLGERAQSVLNKTVRKTGIARKYGSGGESHRHRLLKEWAAEHPEVFGLSNVVGEVEFGFKSGDRADVVFLDARGLPCGVVEVEIEGDRELEVGVHQAVKYRALSKAVRRLSGHKGPVGAWMLSYKRSKHADAIARPLKISTMVAPQKLG